MYFQQIFENTQIYNVIIIRSSGAELFHADIWMDGWTDRHDKANSHFSQFCEHAQKQNESSLTHLFPLILKKVKASHAKVKIVGAHL